MPRKSGNGHSVEFADRKVNVKTFEQSVEVELTDKELLALGDEISTLDAERQTVEDRHGHEKTKYKEDVKRLDARQGQVIQRLRTKKEFRPMLCWNDFDYKEGICTVRRYDTDEEVKTRRMNPDEFKRPLPFNPPKLVEDKSA
jgi:hypothetical protein